MRELMLRPPEQCSRCGESALHTGYTGYTRWWLSRKSLCSRCLHIRAALSPLVGMIIGIVTLIVIFVQYFFPIWPRSTPPLPTSRTAAATPIQGATPVDTQGGNSV